MTAAAARHRQRGVAAVETVLLLPVLLVGLMMIFEVAHLTLIVIIGNLAQESAMAGLRRDTDLLFTDTGGIAERVKDRMLNASYGYLKASEIEVTATYYPSLSAFGSTLTSGEQSAEDGASEEEQSSTSKGFPVLEVQVELTQEWISALPNLVGLDKTFTHTFRQVLGNLYRPTEES